MLPFPFVALLCLALTQGTMIMHGCSSCAMVFAVLWAKRGCSVGLLSFCLLLCFALCVAESFLRACWDAVCWTVVW
jgi:hypothetical protein